MNFVCAMLSTPEWRKELGPYADQLDQAAAQGSLALARTHFLLEQGDERYRSIVHEFVKKAGKPPEGASGGAVEEVGRQLYQRPTWMEPDYDHWLGMTLWPLDEAAFLIHGCKTMAGFNSFDAEKTGFGFKGADASKAMARLRDAIESGKLTLAMSGRTWSECKVRAPEVVTWAYREGAVLPGPLKQLIDDLQVAAPTDAEELPSDPDALSLDPRSVESIKKLQKNQVAAPLVMLLGHYLMKDKPNLDAGEFMQSSLGKALATALQIKQATVARYLSQVRPDGVPPPRGRKSRET